MSFIQMGNFKVKTYMGPKQADGAQQPTAPVNEAAQKLVDHGVSVAHANEFASVFNDLAAAQVGVDVPIVSLIIQLRSGKAAADRILFLREMAKATAEQQAAAGWNKKVKASQSQILSSLRKVFSAWQWRDKYRLRGLSSFDSGLVYAVMNDLNASGLDASTEEIEAVMAQYMEVVQSSSTGVVAQTTAGGQTVVSGGEGPADVDVEISTNFQPDLPSLITAEVPNFNTGGSSVPSTSPNAPATTNNLIDMYSGTLPTAPQTPLAEQIALVNAATADATPPPTAAATFAASGGAPGVYTSSPIARGLAKAKQFAKDRSPVVDTKTGEGSAGIGTLAVIGTILYLLGG